MYLSLSWSKSANHASKHSSCRVMALALSQRFYCELIDSFPKCKYRVCKAEEMKNSIFIYRYGKYWCRNIVLSVLPRKISSQIDSTNFLLQIRKVFFKFFFIFFYFIWEAELKEKNKNGLSKSSRENSTYTSLSALVTDVLITCEFFTIRCTIFYNYNYLACKEKNNSP